MKHATARSLALREPALAAVMGALATADFGMERPSFGGDYGPEFGAEPSPENMAKAWRAQQETAKREALLYPNQGSSMKIQRYTFGVVDTITALATPQSLNAGQNPETRIRPQRVTCNVYTAGFATLTGIKVANVGVIVGGSIDAFDLSPLSQDAGLDVPTLDPSNRVVVTGNYSGRVPAPLTGIGPFDFITSFKGPANMVA